MEVSVVMPCLNEADTLAVCVEKAWRGLREVGAHGEVIVADNGSTDASREIAVRTGARVVEVSAKGYGSALMAGIAAARGKFIIMGDADDSYDFLEIPKFVRRLREGAELVQGCRLPSGGGTVKPGAMPLLHRWIGNPMLTMIARWWFRVPVHDIYCGLRGFTKDLYVRLGQRCTGMEFATENVIKSSLYRARIAEVPITLHPDGRKAHAPHLRTFRDGWRTLRFFILYTPRWLFLIPGGLLLLLGALGFALGMLNGSADGGTEGVLATILAAFAIVCGYQSVLLAVFTKTFAIAEGLLPEDPKMMAFYRLVDLEKGLVFGLGVLLAGAGVLAVTMNGSWLPGTDPQTGGQSLRWIIVGATVAAVGFQTVLSSFFVSILGMHRR
jgi:glycosyltransferase involved in cell wall biosynthesis